MKLNIKEIAIFAMLGAMMFGSKLAMEALPNIHLIGVFIVAFTVVYRQKAIYPISVYIFLLGLYAGFDIWWLPNLYTWFVLWGMTMLIPKSIPVKIQPVVYMCVCAIHGFAYGTLCAPAQALFSGLSWEGMIAWIIAGLSFDLTHGISNFCLGLLIVPVITVLKKAEKLAR